MRYSLVPLLLALLMQITPAEKHAYLGSMDAVAERMGAGSRELAKGNAAVSDTSALAGAYWNPALLAFSRGLSFAAHSEVRALDRAGGSFAIEGGAGGRMGAGFALLFRGDFDFMLVDEDDNNQGTAKPIFMVGYAGFGYRLTRADGIGMSLSIAYDNLGLEEKWGVVNEYQSPLSFNVGWHRVWNSKWESAVTIKNLGLNSKLSAAWKRSPSHDNSLPSGYALRPKTFEAGLTHRNFLMQKKANASLAIITYQMADTLLVFNPDWYVMRARVGLEWEAIPQGNLRAGLDGENPTLGFGYAFTINGKPVYADYAIVYEWDASLFNLFSLTIRMEF